MVRVVDDNSWDSCGVAVVDEIAVVVFERVIDRVKNFD